MKRLFLILISCTLLTCSGCITAESNDELEMQLNQDEQRLKNREQKISLEEQQLEKDEATYKTRDKAAKASIITTIIITLLSWL